MLRHNLFTSNSKDGKKDVNVLKNVKFAHIRHVKMAKMDIPAMKRIVHKNIYLGAKIKMISL